MKSILFILMSSVLLLLSFPRFDFGWLAWAGLVPLLLALHGKRPFKSFLLALLCGALFWAGLVSWLLNVPKYTLLHYVILMPYLGIFFGLFGFFFSLISHHRGLLAAHIAAPLIWVALEFAKTHFFWLALPWGLLAHSQYQHLGLIQIASWTGAYGVSFLVTAVNSVLALVILILTRWRKGSVAFDFGVPPWPAVVGLVLVTAGIMAASLIYGRIVLAKPLEGDRIKISVLQGNIPQEKKWDKEFSRVIMKTYRDLSLEAARDKPALIAWPETATPAAINNSKGVRNQVMKILNEVRVPLLIGSAERRKYDLEGMKKFDYTNAAYLLSNQDGQVQSQRYDKIHLLPFGEYLPTKDSIPWHLLGVKAVSGYRPGTEFTVFQLGQYKFSAPICWENIFPYITRNFVKNGAQFIINITNAAYFGRTSAAYQVLSMNVFRAVENRVYVARAANIGISCIIDPCGRVVGRVKDEKGEDIFVRGYLTGTIIPQTSKTFYTLHGDVFAWICVGISVVFLMGALVKSPIKK